VTHWPTSTLWNHEQSTLPVSDGGNINSLVERCQRDAEWRGQSKQVGISYLTTAPQSLGIDVIGMQQADIV
jgi:hypothetical protein